MVLAADGFCVAEVACAGVPRGWSAEEPIGGLSIVLVRSGVFRRRVDGIELVVDPMVAYFERPGSIQQIAHPYGGDQCTVVVAPPDAFPELQEAPEDLADQLVIPADLDVRHRALLARSRRGANAFELLERATTLTGQLLTRFLFEGSGRAGPPIPARSQVLADQVRQLLLDQTDLGLRELAHMIAVSPYHLSRSFRHATGMTLTRYRRQLRVKRGLQRLADGETDLARLAADLGFSDQAHFTRVTGLEAGATPGQLRALLSPDR